MKKIERFFSVNMVAICLSASSCSQTTNHDSLVPASFQATTPCDEVSRALLHIPSTDTSDMMKWTLSLLTSSTYRLAYTYGMDKAGSRGFSEGAITKEQSGKWTKSKYENAEIYTFTADNSPSLSFIKLNENVLHLLDGNKNVMVGNRAWSYTLNRIAPVKLPSNETSSQKLEETIPADSIVFDGRMPCYGPLLALSRKPGNGCNLIKCRMILYCDNKSHAPSSIKFYTIQVGTGGSRYLATGKWIMMRGTKNDPGSILYQLQIDSQQPQQKLTLLKKGNDILFLLDNELNFMAGNDYCSYTLNRVRK